MLRWAWALSVMWMANPLIAAEYFVDSGEGSDENTGTTEVQAWASLSRLSDLKLGPGDVVRLKRGSTFRGRLVFRGNGAEGAPIKIGAYGEGPKPEILGSVVLDGWQHHEGDVYKAHVPPDVFLGRKAVYSVFEYDGPLPRRLLRSDVIPQQRARFSFDGETSTVYVSRTDGADPGERRTEVSVVEQLVDLTGRSWIEIEDLSFLFGNCRHIVISGSHDVTVRSCASLFVGFYGNPNILIVRDSTRVALLNCFLYENTNCGVFISSGAAGNIVRGCTIVKCQRNDGVTCHSGGRDENGVRQGITGDGNVIEGNVIGLCPEESIDITSGDHHVIRGNICYGNGNPGIIVGHDSDHILIENNICFGNARSGIHIAGKEEEGARGYNRVVRNLVYDNGYPGLEIQAPHTEILNNTVVDSRERVAVRINEMAPGSVLRNNLIVTLDPTIPHPSLHFIGCTPASLSAKLDHNLFYHAADQAKPDVFFPSGQLIRTDDGSFSVRSFAHEYAAGHLNIVGDPGLCETEVGHYFLRPDSPAVDSGTDVGLPFAGGAPDLGWKELGTEQDAPDHPPALIDGTDDAPKVLRLWGKAGVDQPAEDARAPAPWNAVALPDSIRLGFQASRLPSCPAPSWSDQPTTTSINHQRPVSAPAPEHSDQ